MIKKIAFILILSFCFINLATATTINNWNITVQNKIEIHPLLTLQEEVETYTGDIALYDTIQEPTPGNIFVIATFRIEPTPSTTTPFNPEEILLKVADKTYNRLNPDEFLEKFKYIPLPHLKIKKGTFIGSVIYEIPAIDKDQPLSFTYQKEVISTQ